MTGQCAHVTAFERCDCRRRTTLHFLDAEVRRAAASVQRWRWATNGHGRGRAFILGTMKGFGKIAILFGLLGGVMAYFIIPVQFTRSRDLSQPTRPSTSGPSVTTKGTAGRRPKH